MNGEEESDECEEQSGETNEDGEMSCTGGCEGKWSRYNFNELDWNDDPLAEDGIVQCEQCSNWSHNNCVGRAAIHKADQLPDWTCGKCVIDDTEIAQELHVTLNCRSRGVAGCPKEPNTQHVDQSEGMLQMPDVRQRKRQKR